MVFPIIAFYGILFVNVQAKAKLTLNTLPLMIAIFSGVGAIGLAIRGLHATWILISLGISSFFHLLGALSILNQQFGWLKRKKSGSVR